MLETNLKIIQNYYILNLIYQKTHYFDFKKIINLIHK